jgi:hypothetical protein
MMENRIVSSLRSDFSAMWFVAAFMLLGVAMNGYMFLPELAPSMKGENIFLVLVFAASLAIVGLVSLCVALALGLAAIRAAPAGSVPGYLGSLRVPIILVLCTLALGSVFESQSWWVLISNGVRTFAALLAGGLLARQAYSVWMCAIAGVLLFFLDHVAVKTIVFVITREWAAVAGVIISFAMFAFIPMTLAAVAAIVARRMPPATT